MSSIRINDQDKPPCEKQTLLTDSLYDTKIESRVLSSCSIRRHYYLEDENWKNDPLPTSTYDLQMRSQSNFNSLQSELNQTKNQFYQTQFPGSTMSYLEQKQEYKAARKPQFELYVDPEELERRKNKKFEKKIQYQRQINEDFQKELQRQKERKLMLEQIDIDNQRRQQQRELDRKQKQLEYMEQQKQKAQAQEQEYQEMQVQRKSSQDSIINTEQNVPEESLDIEVQKQHLFEKASSYIQIIKQIEKPANLKDLVLILKKGANTPLEKIYKAFLYIHIHISFNYKEYKTGKQTSDLNPDKIIDSGEGTPLAQATLFNEILKLMHFQSVVVQGIGKMLNIYTNGQKYKGQEQDHAWNLVTFQNNIYPVDVSFGSGYLEKGNYFKRLENFYFFTPVLEFLYQHFPTGQDKSKQQLKKNRIWTVEKFAQMPNFSPYYFFNQIQFYNYNTNYNIILAQAPPPVQAKGKSMKKLSIIEKPIETDNSNFQELIFKIRCKNQKHFFHCKLFLKGKECENNNVVDIIETDPQMQMTEITLNFENSATGNYTLEIFASPQNEVDQIEGDAQEEQEQNQSKRQSLLLQQDNQNLQWNSIVTYDVQYTKPK